MTWDDLDLYYGHKAQEMILTDVSDTIHADSLALFALNINIFHITQYFWVKSYKRDQWNLPNILTYISGIFHDFAKLG